MIVIIDNGKGPAAGLDDTTVRAKAEYSINFNEQKNKFCFTFTL